MDVSGIIDSPRVAPWWRATGGSVVRLRARPWDGPAEEARAVLIGVLGEAVRTFGPFGQLNRPVLHHREGYF